MFEQPSLFEPVRIPLTKGYSTLVDPVDADLADLKWCVRDTHGLYAQRTAHLPSRKTVSLHRLVMSRMLGRSLESNERVDHIDGDSLNNRRSNLRLATAEQNAWNARRPKTNKSGYKGVSRKTFASGRGAWEARIHINRKSTFLGYFDTPEAAHEAYCEAARRYRGEFANFGESAVQS